MVSSTGILDQPRFGEGTWLGSLRFAFGKWKQHRTSGSRRSKTGMTFGANTRIPSIEISHTPLTTSVRLGWVGLGCRCPDCSRRIDHPRSGGRVLVFLSGCFCGEFDWVGFLVVCFLYKINPTPRKNICCGKEVVQMTLFLT